MRRRLDRGASALEFALTAPIVLFITLAVVDFGNALQRTIRLESAARAGAQVAFSQPDDQNAIRAAILQSLGIPATGTNNPAGNTSISVSSSCLCPPPGTTAFDCSTGDPVASCGTDDFRQYVSVTVSQPFTALLVVPLTTLRGNVELRLR
ncbi:pilus assembly protein [Roseomonas alkaliterrae]|uniref:Flp pilus assembly protein TadG n=1 Tax=Neoroseomonas alkaliterrae TaxID=1452450 RepID=A0A840Y8D1_9PROT|nr:TadE/TadG family type IV pilus assembly protein [Neoroseomonas alkaliterrae]MBB5690293.1 Flp pilus assembly protein TadG [Neoroseomonas alkaliterrae]MBR0676173.1 pilus assembly protein [Neoroseomonas alkaliterrae]